MHYFSTKELLKKSVLIYNKYSRIQNKRRAHGLFFFSKYVLQRNKYETAPNVIQLTQNLTSDCLLI